LVEKPDHWHRRLLRARRKRPRRRRATEQLDEVASVQLMHLVPVNQGRISGYRIGENQSGGKETICNLSIARAIWQRDVVLAPTDGLQEEHRMGGNHLAHADSDAIKGVPPQPATNSA
jgi:hypothetical protein